MFCLRSFAGKKSAKRCKSCREDPRLPTNSEIKRRIGKWGALRAAWGDVRVLVEHQEAEEREA